jgi:hypothetical protein
MVQVADVPFATAEIVTFFPVTLASATVEVRGAVANAGASSPGCTLSIFSEAAAEVGAGGSARQTPASSTSRASSSAMSWTGAHAHELSEIKPIRMQ